MSLSVVGHVFCFVLCSSVVLWLMEGGCVIGPLLATLLVRAAVSDRSGRNRDGPNVFSRVCGNFLRLCVACYPRSFVGQTPVQQRHVQLLGRSVDLTHRVSGAMNRKISEVS